MFIYHAAPTTERPIHRPMPRSAHTYGDIDSRNAPTYLEGNCEMDAINQVMAIVMMMGNQMGDPIR